MALPNQPPWWELFDVRFEDICEVCCEMQALYARPKAQYINVREEAQVAHSLVSDIFCPCNLGLIQLQENVTVLTLHQA